jgi:PAS domain S-box-containing protein
MAMTRFSRRVLLLSAGAALLVAASFVFDLFETLSAWLGRHERWQLGELFLAAVVGVAVMLCLALRRSRVLRRAAREEDRLRGILTEEERRLRLLLESTKAVPWEADARTLLFTYVGTQAAEIFGHPLYRWYEIDFWADHIHPDDRQETLKFCLEHSQRTSDYDFEYRWLTSNGRVRWVHDIVHVESADGVPTRLRGFMIDITDRKRMEVALEEAHRDLERRVERRTLDLREANARLQQTLMERQRAEDSLRHSQGRLRGLASELALGEERERRRLAADLHDRTIQMLGLSRIKLGALRESRKSGERDAIVHDLQGLVDQAIGDTRSLIFELSPPILYELGFESAVEWLVERLEEREGITGTFKDDHEAKPLAEDVRVALFQAVRELLNNVGRHARAHHVEVSLLRAGDTIRVQIDDDGVGFDPHVVEIPASDGGYGLFSIRERLDLLGGALSIESTPETGTRALVMAPLRTGGAESHA